MTDRFNRDVDVYEPALVKKPPRGEPGTVKVSGLWAVRDTRKNEIRGYCLSEVAANAVAAHAQFFVVEYVEGPFDMPDGPPADVQAPLVGRFRRIVEGE